MTALSFEIDYLHEHAGWIDCWLTIDSEKHHLFASGVFPPFRGLLHFLQAVATQRLPATFSWDEEATGAEFLASSVDKALVHLKITYEGWELPPVLWLDTELPRASVVQAFLPPLLDMAKNYRRAGAWGIPHDEVQRVTKTMPLNHIV